MFRTLVSAVLLLAAGPLLAGTFTACVVGITDGDTITVLDGSRQQHKIRLAGIDAPEKKMPYGQRSKQHLASLVFGKDARLECGKVDRYRRNVCVVLINGRDANLAQVEAGMAWWYLKYAKKQTAQRNR